jgi:hypothetical protein
MSGWPAGRAFKRPPMLDDLARLIDVPSTRGVSGRIQATLPTLLEGLHSFVRVSTFGA